MSEDPLHYYVRDAGSRVAHHWDYTRDRSDRALCGHHYARPVWEGTDRPRWVCRACQDLVAPHEARWWRQRAEDLQIEVNGLNARVQDLQKRLNRLGNELSEQRRVVKDLKRRLKQLSTTSRKGSTPTAPDNSQEAVATRLKALTGPLSAANVSSTWRTPAGRVRIVPGGLPGHGKKR